MRDWIVRAGLTAIVVIGLAACVAPATRWENPALPRDQWAVDRAACDAAAKREVEREYRAERSYGAAADEDPNSHAGRMSRYDAAKDVKALAASCLRAKGYQQVTVKGR